MHKNIPTVLFHFSLQFISKITSLSCNSMNLRLLLSLQKLPKYYECLGTKFDLFLLNC